MLTKGTIVYDGKLTLDITGIYLRDGTINLSSVARRPRKKDIPHGEGQIPYVIYGEDEEPIAVGLADVSMFNEPRKQICHGDLFLTLPIHTEIMS